MTTTSSYINGHHPSVIRSHNWRTASNSAAYLLPHLKSPSLTLLDVGCGPGSITLDFASLLPSGHVWGIDPSDTVIEQAEKAAKEHGITNVTFLVGDIFDLSSVLPTQRFDVVHAHQVLQHVTRPLDAIRAMSQALKPGGILACREVDFGAMAWWPFLPALEDWRQLWQKVAKAAGCDANMGRRLVALMVEAGFTRDQITATAGTWCYTLPGEREWWGGLWAERLLKSEYATRALKTGLTTEQELQRQSEAWTEWAGAHDGWCALMHGEIICRMKQ